jgi:hypothetical protein
MLENMVHCSPSTFFHNLGVYFTTLKSGNLALQGAKEMVQMEHVMNVYASKAAKGCIAEFIGYCDVEPEEATSRLTQGIWLVSSSMRLT